MEPAATSEVAARLASAAGAPASRWITRNALRGVAPIPSRIQNIAATARPSAGVRRRCVVGDSALMPAQRVNRAAATLVSTYRGIPSTAVAADVSAHRAHGERPVVGTGTAVSPRPSSSKSPRNVARPRLMRLTRQLPRNVRIYIARRFSHGPLPKRSLDLGADLGHLAVRRTCSLCPVRVLEHYGIDVGDAKHDPSYPYGHGLTY